tara:strand:+ start:80 stop:478 length:399 start_codon:yes stop_codon:yes gene_type:complete
MKNIITILFLLFSYTLFSQVITFECNNEIVTISYEELSTNYPEAYKVDLNGDVLIDESDYIIYLQQIYGCDWWNDINENKQTYCCSHCRAMGEHTLLKECLAPIYDLQGKLLKEKPKRGFYVQGGKKYYIIK